MVVVGFVEGGKLTPVSRARVSPPASALRAPSSAMRTQVETYLLPVFLQRWHGGEVAGVVHQLEFLKDTVVR